MQGLWSPWHGLGLVSESFAFFQIVLEPNNSRQHAFFFYCRLQQQPALHHPAMPSCSWSRIVTDTTWGVNVGVANCTRFCRSPPVCINSTACYSEQPQGAEEIMSARLGPTNGRLVMSQTGIKPSGQRCSNPATFQSQEALVVPPLQCSRLCLNSLNQICVLDCWRQG